MKRLTKILTKKFLEKEYIVNKKSTIQIAKQIRCSDVTVCNYLKKYEIPLKSLSEARKLLIGKNSNHYTDGHTLKPNFCIDCGKQIHINNKRCMECNAKDKSKKMKGNNSHRYIDGRTSLYDSIRNSFETQEWRKQIFKRDNYTCQHCGDNTGHNLNAHHKEPFAVILNNFLIEYDQFSPIEDKETLVRLAMKYKPFWDINNGKTLCEDCHKEELKVTFVKIKSKEKIK